MSMLKNRQLEMLSTAMGTHIMAYLAKPSLVEIMLNPDGQVFVEDLAQGKYLTDLQLPPEQSMNIIKLVAAFKNDVADESRPMISAELPFGGARFQGWLPPVVAQPTFCIRKRASQIFTLTDYVKQGILTVATQRLLEEAVAARKNIIIVGGTGSGKTTFANALLSTLTDTAERLLVLEDLHELQINAPDVVFMETTATVSMRDLVKGALRMRPDRIIVGEVRDGAALDMLKAWNTGHPGGICTIHANSVESAPYRLEDLIQEVVVTVPRNLILQAVDLFVFMDRDRKGKRRIKEVASLERFAQGEYKVSILNANET